MLTIDDLHYRIAARQLFEGASAQIAGGWKVGLVGRNGTGKSTLLHLIREAYASGHESIRLNQGARLGFVAQEVAPVETSLLDVVLEADTERASLMTELETAHDPNRIADIHLRLTDIDAWSAEARAAEVLAGLGFSQGDLARPCREFSGGWRMRAALAGVLFSTPDLLLLDEPTNYLDLEGAAWLESYLRKYPNTVVIVSHDRELLNRSVTHILALEAGKLVLCPGGYDTYLKVRAERAANLAGQKVKQDAQRAHLQEFVDRFRAKASKARQAQSRVKMLEKMQEITVPLEERTVPFKLSDPEELASPILEMEHAELGYVAGRPILSDVNVRIDMDDRIAIVGANGQGKTTLVKSIAERLKMLDGSRRAAKALRVGYFSQDQLDELRQGETVLDHVRDLEREATQSRVRAIAAQFGFGAEKVGTKVENLSGGEKVRLLLGLTTWTKPHILILDEPTSHLDIDSREALIYALNAYKGAVLLITHDTYLAEGTTEQLWLVKDGGAHPYDGDISDYRTMVLSADRAERQGAPSTIPATKAEPAAPAAKSAGKPSNKQRFRVSEAEKRIAEAQAELAKLDRELASADAFADRESGQARLKARAEWAAKLEAAEADWLEASAEVEALGG